MQIVNVRWLIPFFLLLGPVGCQAGAVDAPQEASPSPVQVPPLAPCGSGAAHVDREKIYQSLVKQGVITEQMSKEQAEQKLMEYIKKRQQAYSKCLKRNKP
ncbi:hypothetical protein [Shewanella sp.]|uniref:hypothetical protein n=1 Tax=Shewanella sp. TaxID=50422 RepID=UPI003A96D1FF